MAQINPLQELHAFRESLKSFEGDSVSWRRAMEALQAVVPFSQALVISTLPRGGTGILQPGGCPTGLVHAYGSEAFAWDKATWQSIGQDKVVEGRHLWSAQEADSGVYYRQIMQPQHWKHLVAAPLKAPVLLGYPGAMHLYRRAEEGEFTTGQMKWLAEAVQILDAANDQYREPRRHPGEVTPAVWERPRLQRQFIFDAHGRQHLAARSPIGVLDEALRTGLRQELQQRLTDLDKSGAAKSAKRVLLRDHHGELWAFRATAYRQFPALGRGSVRVFLFAARCAGMERFAAGGFCGGRKDVAADSHAAHDATGIFADADVGRNFRQSSPQPVSFSSAIQQVTGADAQAFHAGLPDSPCQMGADGA